MIVKIQSDFDNIKDIFDVFKQYNLIFVNNALYLSSNEEISNANIRKIIGENCFISTVTINSLKSETFSVQQWCKDEFVKQDLFRYEQDSQSKLKNIMISLDNIEQEIFN